MLSNVKFVEHIAILLCPRPLRLTFMKFWVLSRLQNNSERLLVGRRGEGGLPDLHSSLEEGERESLNALMRKKKELMVIAMIASVAYDGSTGRSEIPAQSAWPVEEIPRVCLES